jgi:hypothetical protein
MSRSKLDTFIFIINVLCFFILLLNKELLYDFIFLFLIQLGFYYYYIQEQTLFKIIINDKLTIKNIIVNENTKKIQRINIIIGIYISILFLFKIYMKYI